MDLLRRPRFPARPEMETRWPHRQAQWGLLEGLTYGWEMQKPPLRGLGSGGIVVLWHSIRGNWRPRPYLRTVVAPTCQFFSLSWPETHSAPVVDGSASPFPLYPTRARHSRWMMERRFTVHRRMKRCPIPPETPSHKLPLWFRGSIVGLGTGRWWQPNGDQSPKIKENGWQPRCAVPSKSFHAFTRRPACGR